MFRHETRRDWPESVTAVGRRRAYGPREVPDSWRSRVVPAAQLIADDGSNYVITPDLMPPIIDVPDSPRRRLRRAWRRATARIATTAASWSPETPAAGGSAPTG